jgi:hypothetical protein
MKILLAPAETKRKGGTLPYSSESFFFQEFNNTRDKVVSSYEKFLKTSTLEQLSAWFGLKNLKECEKYSNSITKKPTMKAIQRYTGVAFDALDYDSLSSEQQKYCDENVVLFSNLFGPLKADDKIPDYKFKQGENLSNIDVINQYRIAIKDTLDNYLGDEVIDLRAGFYDKFYKPTTQTITFKFLKDGKVVSHWAKHYRGKIVKELAQNNVKNFNQLMRLEIEGLILIEIQEKKNLKTFIMEIK